MESISLDLKVMSTSFRRYNYLMVRCCNNSCYIIEDALKTWKATEVAESIFHKLICTQGTNITEIYCDLDTAFKNEIIRILLSSFKINVKICSVQSDNSNSAERSIQSILNILIHYIYKYNNTLCLFHGLSAFCLLGNYSAYSILFGRDPPDLSEIQVEKSRLTKISHYHFGDYLYMLNERMSCIRNIVKEHHNETKRKRQLDHGSAVEKF